MGLPIGRYDVYFRQRSWEDWFFLGGYEYEAPVNAVVTTNPLNVGARRWIAVEHTLKILGLVYGN